MPLLFLKTVICPRPAVFYARLFIKEERRSAGSCPGAEALPAVPKVMADPNTLPHTLLIIPWRPMDMVITGVSYVLRAW